MRDNLEIGHLKIAMDVEISRLLVKLISMRDNLEIGHLKIAMDVGIAQLLVIN